ncbi:MAG: hypothetical protein ACRDPE_19310 [Solirubrobacterales bacterium]
MPAAPEKPATIVVCEGEGRSLDLLCEELIGDGPRRPRRRGRHRYDDPDLMRFGPPQGAG